MAQPVPYIETAHWRLRVPTAPPLHRTVCTPTIHPIGDQRVLRCAQAVLDAGYDLHFIWLGGIPGESLHHPRVRETRLPAAGSFGDRLRVIPRIIRHAWAADPDLLHIHDFYLLPLARAWSRRTHRPVLYDVHEYYPEYYSHRLPLPRRLRRPAQRALATVENRLCSGIGGANAVSGQLRDRFRSVGVPAVATPNFPSSNVFAEQQRRALTPALLRRVVHTGTLDHGYGSDLLLPIARRLAELAPDVELLVISRFPSDAARSRFLDQLARDGQPANLTLLDPMAAHRIPALLAGCGIGLSLLQDVGQSPLAVPTKLYEYVRAGLAIVASDLPATRRFVNESGAGALVPAADAESYAKAIAAVIERGEETCRLVDSAATAARTELSWDRVCAPRIRSLILALDVARTGRPTVGSQHRREEADLRTGAGPVAAAGPSAGRLTDAR